MKTKFRGKRIGGDEWVFGDLLHDRDMHPHIVPQNQGFDIDDDMCEVYAVDPDTVGQYTGLKDKNGQEVYEGDLLKCGNIVYVCEWGNGRFTLRFGAKSQPIGSIDQMESIGNIHDNPKLMKGGER